MSGRNSLTFKKLILEALRDGKSNTYAKLERKINTNWKTIRDHCHELELFGCIDITKKSSHERNNKPFNDIKISKYGLKVLKRISSQDSTA